MAKSRIPVNLFNPGQVFACLGFMELAEVLLGDAEAGFDWSDARQVVFHLAVAGEEDPIKTAIAFVVEAQVNALSSSKGVNTQKWKVVTRELDADEAFPYPQPNSPATLPIEMSKDSVTFQVNHWGDATVRDNVKFWAGSGGYPGAALWRDAVELAKDKAVAAHADPFALAAPQSSSFRLDWRRDYIPLDAGFSPNEHDDMDMVGYPLVELFAAIGLTHARPQRPERRNKLLYRYGVIGNASKHAERFPPSLIRAALGAQDMPFLQRRFRMNLGWPGQENQARCITTVIEE
ncbi:MAG: type I-U CRISPR-associated protein Cas8c [Solimonas sp.]